MLVMLSLRMLEVPVSSAGNVIPREAQEVVGGQGKGGCGGGGRMEEKNVGEEEEDGQTTNSSAGDGKVKGAKGSNAKCSNYGEISHKMVR